MAGAAESKNLNSKDSPGERLYEVLRHLPNVVLYETGGGREFISKNVEELLGYGVEKYEERDFFVSIMHPDDAEMSKKKLKEWHDGGEQGVISMEFRCQHKDGSWVWLQDYIMAIKPEGQKQYMAGVMIDITRRKMAEDQVKAQEEKYRLLFSEASDAIFLMDGDIFIECNEKTLKMFECKLEDIVNQNPWNFSPQKQPDGSSSKKKASEKIKAALKGDSQFFLWQHKTKKGKLFDAEVSLNRFETGDKRYIQAIVRDVTARSEAERLLKESEERFKLLSGAALEGITISEEGRIIDANDQFARMHGYVDSKDVIGKNIEDFIVPEYVDLTYRNIEMGYHRPFTLKSRKKNGNEITVEARGENMPYYGRTVRIIAMSDITERINYENQLKESHERYKNHIESLPDGVLILENNKIVFANPSALKILGTSTVQIKKAALENYLLSEYKGEFADLLKSIRKGETSRFAELKITRPNDKKIADIEASGRIVKFKGEESIQLVVHDISTRKQLAREQLRAQIAEETNIQLQREIVERKKAEGKLIKAQKYAKSIIESSLDMIVATDIDNRINEFNIAAEKTFGFKRSEVLGKHIEMLFADREEHKQVMDLLEKEGTFAGEIVNKRSDQSLFISYLSASVLKDENGEIIGAMGVSRDITAIKKAEEELRLSEERHRAIYDQAYIGIARIGKVGRFLLVNQRLCDMLGYTSDELYKKAFFELTHPEEVENSLKNWDALLSGEIKNFTSEQRYTHKNGTYVVANLTVSMVRDASGNPNYYVAVFEDITDRKEQELKLQRSLKEKEVLLKEVHHRVKNNMQVISSILNLQSSYIKDPEAIDMLRESQDRIKSMSFIHESLYQSKDLSHVNFTEYVRNLVNNLFRTYGVNIAGLKLTYDLDEVALNIDTAIPCGLVINELISNALKYAFKGRDKGELRVILKRLSDKKLKLVVADDGVGFPDDIDYRDTESLGLQLVVTLVGQIRGEVHLDNKKGTKFTIEFEESKQVRI